MAQIKFLFGTLSQYNNLATKDDNSLYFITDTYEIYKGNQLYTSSYEIATSPSAVTSPKGNYVYIFTDKKYLAEYRNNSWVALTPEVTEDLSVTNALPLTQAVKAAIDNIQAAIDLQAETVESHTTSINDHEEMLNTLNGGADVAGSVANAAKAAAADAIAEFVADADADFDTLKEISEYIKSDKENAAQINIDISALKQEVGLSGDGSTSSGSLAERVEQLEETVDDSLSGRIEDLETQIEGIISTGGEANLVDDVQINNISILENKIANFNISADGSGKLTINGKAYTIAELGQYVLANTYNARVTEVDERLDVLESNIANVNTTLGTRITNLQTTMEANDAALSARIDGISVPELSWGSLT